MPSRSTNQTYANVPDRPNPVSALNAPLEGVSPDKRTGIVAGAEPDSGVPSGPSGPLMARAGTEPVAQPTAGAAADLAAKPKRKR